jgi:hypothetical protein
MPLSPKIQNSSRNPSVRRKTWWQQSSWVEKRNPTQKPPEQSKFAHHQAKVSFNDNFLSQA